MLKSCAPLFLFFLLLIFPSEGKSAPSQSFSGKRAIFQGTTTWMDPDQTNVILQRIKNAGFNVLVIQVWNGRGTTWPSVHAPWDPEISKAHYANHDPLSYLISQAHELEIEVHAWFSLSHRLSETLHPEWAPPGTPERAFDVHNPDFRAFLADLVGEVVKKYNIDGINLDFVRTKGLCYSEYCQTQYKQLYDRNLLTDNALFKVTPGNLPKQTLLPTLVEYQEKDVTAMVKTVADRIRKFKPDLMIGVDVLPEEAWLGQGQNSIDWIQGGIVTTLFRMDYGENIQFEKTETIRDLLPDPDSLTLLISNIHQNKNLPIGQQHSPRSGTWLADNISEIVKRWPNTGIAVYMLKYLSDEQIQALKQGPFKKDETPPHPPQGFRVQ